MRLVRRFHTLFCEWKRRLLAKIILDCQTRQSDVLYFSFLVIFDARSFAVCPFALATKYQKNVHDRSFCPRSLLVLLVFLPFSVVTVQCSFLSACRANALSAVQPCTTAETLLTDAATVFVSRWTVPSDLDSSFGNTQTRVSTDPGTCPRVLSTTCRLAL